jgi:hypothetical protein
MEIRILKEDGSAASCIAVEPVARQCTAHFYQRRATRVEDWNVACRQAADRLAAISIITSNGRRIREEANSWQGNLILR